MGSLQVVWQAADAMTTWQNNLPGPSEACLLPFSGTQFRSRAGPAGGQASESFDMVHLRLPLGTQVRSTCHPVGTCCHIDCTCSATPATKVSQTSNVNLPDPSSGAQTAPQSPEV
jgi:hypothetical protein